MPFLLVGLDWIGNIPFKLNQRMGIREKLVQGLNMRKTHQQFFLLISFLIKGK
jgi:hypothetical protein